MSFSSQFWVLRQKPSAALMQELKCKQRGRVLLIHILEMLPTLEADDGLQCCQNNSSVYHRSFILKIISEWGNPQSRIMEL